MERKFAIFYGSVKAMLNGAKLAKATRDGLWSECADTATHMANILTKSKKANDPNPPTVFGRGEFTRCLHTFGEVGIVLFGEVIQSNW